MNTPASATSRILLGALVLAWLAGLGLFLMHRIVVTNDSLSNYAHVRLISEHLREQHSLPWKLHALLHGTAPAFPYGFLPWVTAALARPLLGDWVSTLWMVIGLGGLIGGTFVAFPELRRAPGSAGILANPVLVETIVLFQMPFAWAAATFMFAIWAFRRDRLVLAGVLAGLAQAGHAAVLMPIVAVAVVVVVTVRRERRLLWAYGLSLVIAAPAAVIVLLSPVVTDASRATLVANLLGTVAWRSLVFAVPVFLVWLARQRPAWLLPFAGGLLALNAIIVPLRHNQYGWGLFLREPDQDVARFTRTQEFQPGGTYRILRSGDGKVGMYQLISAGAQLDSEFFPESIERRHWDSQPEYAEFLAGRSVEFVMIFDDYDPAFGTNEGAMLDAMVTGRCADIVTSAPLYTVYRVRPAECETSRQ